MVQDLVYLECSVDFPSHHACSHLLFRTLELALFVRSSWLLFWQVLCGRATPLCWKLCFSSLHQLSFLLQFYSSSSFLCSVSFACSVSSSGFSFKILIHFILNIFIYFAYLGVLCSGLWSLSSPLWLIPWAGMLLSTEAFIYSFLFCSLHSSVRSLIVSWL